MNTHPGGDTLFVSGHLLIRLRQRLQVRVFQCVPAAHARGSHVNSYCRQNLVAVLTRTTRFSTNLVPRPTSSLQVQRRVKRLVLKGADTLWNVPCNLSCNVLATLWHLVDLKVPNNYLWDGGGTGDQLSPLPTFWANFSLLPKRLRHILSLLPTFSPISPSSLFCSSPLLWWALPSSEPTIAPPLFKMSCDQIGKFAHGFGTNYCSFVITFFVTY